jgi:acetyl esterase
MTKLAKEIEAWLVNFNELLASLRERGFKPTPESARQGMETITKTLVTEVPEVRLVEDGYVARKGGSVPVRMYHPEPENFLPVLVYLHGGGHMSGSVRVYDPLCRKMAISARRIVISVDYRLSPENPYPAGLEDGRVVLQGCFDLLERHHFKFDKRLALGGDSAGGAMSASLAHACQDDPQVEIKDLVLIYPSLDYTMSSESYEKFSREFLLERESIQWYFDNYFQAGEDRKAASPLYMDLTPSFPRTLIVTAGYCPLQDEGLKYMEKLRAGKVQVEHVHYPDMIHAFLNMENLAFAQCTDFYRQLGVFLC